MDPGVGARRLGSEGRRLGAPDLGSDLRAIGLGTDLGAIDLGSDIEATDPSLFFKITPSASLPKHALIVSPHSRVLALPHP
jgi:hypothetical protein